MKAIIYNRYGSPDVLQLQDVGQPEVTDDRFLIRVRAASVNPYDWHFMRGDPWFMRMSSGLFKPKDTRLGADLAGEVVAVGKSVTQFQVGDEVFGEVRGAFAEYASASPANIALKPANLSFEEAAAVPMGGLTALQGLRDRGKLVAGERVLVNGASGGVGIYAVQIAKSYGAEVTGVCSGRNVEMVRSLGADHVIDYTTDDFTKSDKRYDLIVENIGNRPLSAIRRVLTPKGRYLMIGGPLLRFAGVLIQGSLMRRPVMSMLAASRCDDLVVLKELVEAGKVRPVIDRTYPLSETAEAVRYVETGHARGKVVISV